MDLLWIRERRQELDMSQGALALRAGILQNTLSKIESGKTKDPGATVLIKLIPALEMDYNEFFGRALGSRTPKTKTRKGKPQPASPVGCQ